MFNVNSLLGKQTALEHFIRNSNLGIIAVQETLIDEYKYRLTMRGYVVYCRPNSGGAQFQ
jgi:exonuclease III